MGSKPPVERVHPPDWLMRLVNPLMRRRLARGGGKIGDQVLVLHYRGRKSAHPYSIPVGYRTIRGRLAMLTNSRWRHNFRGGRPVEVTLRGERRPARAELLSDPQAVAEIYDELIGELGWEKSGRRLGIKINAGRRPNQQELEAMVQRSGLSVVWLDLDGPGGAGTVSMDTAPDLGER